MPRTPIPTALPVTPATVPSVLTEACGWIVWRYTWRPYTDGGKWAKVPLSVDLHPARTNDPRTHTAFANAVGTYQRLRATASPLSGIGLVLPAPAPGDPALVAVDVDGGVDPATGTLSPAVAELLAPLRGHAFVEVSPSGTGVHLFAYGPLPPRHRWDAVPGVKAVEAWGGGGGARYVTVTGHQLPGWEGAPDPSPASVAAVAAVWAGLEATAPSAAAPRPPAVISARPEFVRVGPLAGAGGDPRLEEVLRRAHGVRGFSALWRGDFSAVGGNRSRADNRACYVLRLVGAEVDECDTLIRRSALYRDKWDDARGTSTYGALTIANAFAAASPLPDRPLPTLYVGAPSPTLPAPTPPTPRQSPYDPRSGAGADETGHHPAEAMLARIRAVLAVPADALSAVDKVIAIAAALAIDETDATRIRDHAASGGVDVDALPALTVDALRRAPRPVTRAALGRTAGVSADTAGTAIRRLAERGILTARTRSERWAAVDDDGVLSEGWTRRLEIAPAVDESGESVDVLTAAARYRAETPRRHGGRRLPASGCALHPRADAICRDCLVAILPPGALPKIDREIHRLHTDAAVEVASIVDAAPSADGWAVGAANPDTVKLTVSQFAPPTEPVPPATDAAYLARTRSPLADAPRLDTPAYFAHVSQPPARAEAEARPSPAAPRQAELFGGAL